MFFTKKCIKQKYFIQNIIVQTIKIKKIKNTQIEMIKKTKKKNEYTMSDINTIFEIFKTIELSRNQFDFRNLIIVHKKL